jgi:DeoR/GlpR family transcriptional regulator of sugar metabolism
MSDDLALIPDQRREKLMRALHRDQVLSVAQVVDLLGVSHMTVRRDIAALERDGRAYSVPGGVRVASGQRSEPAFDDKSASEQPQKRAIALVAEKLLRDDMVVYLDAGTTTGALVGAIQERSGMTIITNDFAIVDQLIDRTHVDVIHTGGRLEHANRSAVGRLAAETLMRINSDIAFISASSWDLTRGLTTPSEAKVAVKQAALESTSEAVLVVTSSKYGTFGMYDIAPLRRFDRIITDNGLPLGAAAGIRDLGVTVDLARPAQVDVLVDSAP